MPDLIVDGPVIADPKAVEAFNAAHARQMIGYLAMAKLQLALLLNFKHAKLEWKRIVRENTGKDSPRMTRSSADQVPSNQL